MTSEWAVQGEELSSFQVSVPWAVNGRLMNGVSADCSPGKFGSERKERGSHVLRMRQG